MYSAINYCWVTDLIYHMLTTSCFPLSFLVLPPPEIIKVVQENKSELLVELLRVKSSDLEDQCLERALRAAVDNNSHSNVGKLVVKGATNAEECLEIAKNEKKHHARAMLLLIKAARENDKDLVLRLFGDSRSNHVSTGVFRMISTLFSLLSL